MINRHSANWFREILIIMYIVIETFGSSGDEIPLINLGIALQQDGHEIYAIESIPNEDAAVVWGREVLRIRDDYILLEHLFYDQDDVLIKSLESLEIGERGGRTVATRQRMARVEMEDEWTEIYVEEMEFGVELRNGLFTLSNLRNPRE